MTRALLGGADCARAGVAVVLRGFGNASATEAWEEMAVVGGGGAGGATRAAGVADETTPTPTPTLGALDAGGVMRVVVNARYGGIVSGAAAMAVLDALRAKGPIEEACFVLATRDEAAAADAARESNAFLAYEDVYNGARASDSVGIVARPLGAGGLSAKDGVLATVMRALQSCGTKTRVLYAPAFEASKFDREALERARAVTHRLGRAVEASAFGLSGYDAEAVDRLTPASDAAEPESSDALYT